MYNQKPLAGDLLDYGDWSTDGLVACYLMNEDNNSDKVFDLSGNGNTIPLTNMSWTLGKYGSAIEANANGEIGLIDNTGNNVINSEAGTIVMYFKSNQAFADGVTHHLIGKRGAGNTVGDFSLMKFSDDSVYFIFHDGAALHYLRFTLSSYFPNWQTGQQIVIQWDRNNVIWNGDNMVLLVDGVPQIPPVVFGETSWNTFTIATSIGILNDSDETDNDADGVKEYLYIYDRVLSFSEIALLYREPFRMIRTRRRRIIYDEIAGAPPGSFPYYYREIASRRIA